MTFRKIGFLSFFSLLRQLEFKIFHSKVSSSTQDYIKIRKISAI